ncbi:hypothetical protein VTK73DRAFT_7566 [Phialemonium thermophilum]|uniref:Uncharacterized protein n=1 Tax=Phialemonium thermophilum TaxID=223376 RepID=A0ABR3WEG2_9PEZI
MGNRLYSSCRFAWNGNGPMVGRAQPPPARPGFVDHPKKETAWSSRRVFDGGRERALDEECIQHGRSIFSESLASLRSTKSRDPSSYTHTIRHTQVKGHGTISILSVTYFQAERVEMQSTDSISSPAALTPHWRFTIGSTFSSAACNPRPTLAKSTREANKQHGFSLSLSRSWVVSYLVSDGVAALGPRTSSGNRVDASNHRFPGLFPTDGQPFLVALQ